MVLKSFMFLTICAVLVFVGYSDAEGRVLVVPKHVSDFIREAINNCTSNTKDINDLYTLVKLGKYREDDDFKQLVHCSYTASGFAYEDGRLNIEAATNVFPEDLEFKKALLDCVKMGANPAETNWLSFKCFQDTSPVHLQL